MTLNDKLRAARGKGYFTVLKAILAKCGQDIINDAQEVKRKDGRITPFNIAEIALKHDLNFKATCEWLEESGVIPSGSHQKLIERGFRATLAFEAVRKNITTPVVLR